MRAALYLRQSDTSKKAIAGADQTLSLDTQEEVCRSCADREGAEVAKVYAEQFTSDVFLDGRPKLTDLMADLAAYDLIIVYKYDRIVRDPDKLLAFMRLVRAQGVRVLSATEPEYPDDELGDMFLFMQGTMSKMHRRRIAQGSIEAVKRLNSKGLLTCHGTPLYGYQYDLNTRTRVIREDQAEVVRRIFKLVNEGQPLRQIANTLNAEGVPGPRTDWKITTLSMLVREPSYYGEPFKANKRSQIDKRLPSGKRSDKRNPAEDHQAIGDGTPPIVTREVWDKAQRQLATRKKRPGSTLNLWLRGHIVCAHCGAAMSASKDKQRYVYRCVGKQRGADCPNKPHPIEWVEDNVWSRILDAIKRPGYLRKRVGEALTAVEGRDYAAEVASTEKTISKLKSKLARLAGRLGDEDDDDIAAAIKTEMRQVGDQIKQEEGVRGELVQLGQTRENRLSKLSGIEAQLDQMVLYGDSPFEVKKQVADLFEIEVRCGVGMIGETIAVEQEPGASARVIEYPGHQAPDGKAISVAIFATQGGCNNSVRRFQRTTLLQSGSLAVAI